jgi:hypothetical protein
MTLDEEGATDKKLTEIAQSLNVEAAEQSDEEEEPAIVTQSRRAGNGGRSSQKRH